MRGNDAEYAELLVLETYEVVNIGVLKPK